MNLVSFNSLNCWCKYVAAQVIRSFQSRLLSVENAGSARVQKRTCVNATGENHKQHNLSHISFILTTFIYIFLSGRINDHVDIMSYPTTRFTCRGQPILQFTGTGTLSEYIVINQIYVAKIHDDAPLDRVCLLGCGIPTGYGAAINTAGVCIDAQEAFGHLLCLFLL